MISPPTTTWPRVFEEIRLKLPLAAALKILTKEPEKRDFKELSQAPPIKIKQARQDYHRDWAKQNQVGAKSIPKTKRPHA